MRLENELNDFFIRVVASRVNMDDFLSFSDYLDKDGHLCVSVVLMEDDPNDFLGVPDFAVKSYKLTEDEISEFNLIHSRHALDDGYIYRGEE